MVWNPVSPNRLDCDMLECTLAVRAEQHLIADMYTPRFQCPADDRASVGNRELVLNLCFEEINVK